MKHVYVMTINGVGCKVGIARNPQRRLEALQTAHPLKLSLYWTSLECEPFVAAVVEQMVHEHFSPYRLQGEWFGVEPESAAQAVRDALQSIADHDADACEVLYFRLTERVKRVLKQTPMAGGGAA